MKLILFFHLMHYNRWIYNIPKGSRLITNSQLINQGVSINGICDRWDLPLECIRLFYLKQESPLTKTLNNYSSFFELYNDFEDYVKFFLMEDLVSNDFKSINFFLEHKSFELNPIPKFLR